MENYKPLLVDIPADSETRSSEKVTEVYVVQELVVEGSIISEIIKSEISLGAVDQSDNLRMKPTHLYKKLNEIDPFHLTHFNDSILTATNLKYINSTNYDKDLNLRDFLLLESLSEEIGFLEAAKKTWKNEYTNVMASIQVNLNNDVKNKLTNQEYLTQNYCGLAMRPTLKELILKMKSTLTAEKMKEFFKNFNCSENIIYRRNLKVNNKATIYIHSNLSYPERHLTSNFPQKNNALILVNYGQILLGVVPFDESQVLGNNLIQEVEQVLHNLNICEKKYIIESRFCNDEVINDLKNDELIIISDSESGIKSRYFIKQAKHLLLSENKGKFRANMTSSVRLKTDCFWRFNVNRYGGIFGIYDLESKKIINSNIDKIIKTTSDLLKDLVRNKIIVRDYLPYSFLFKTQYNNQGQLTRFKLDKTEVKLAKSNHDFYLLQTNIGEPSYHATPRELKYSNLINEPNFLINDYLKECQDSNIAGIKQPSIYLNLLTELLKNGKEYNNHVVNGKELSNCYDYFESITVAHFDDQWLLGYRPSVFRRSHDVGVINLSEKRLQLIIDKLNTTNYKMEEDVWIPTSVKEE